MSGVFKAVGKVFKKVFKVVKKVLPYALAAAAVIFTGGAALGVLPTFSAAVGGLVGGLGLSAGVTGALTGAITSAGFGGALGFITGGKKGLQKGFLMGALTGGVMGAVNPSAFGIVKGLDGAVTTANTIAHGGNAFGAAGKGAFALGKTAEGLSYPILKGAGGGMSPVVTGAPGAISEAGAVGQVQAPAGTPPIGSPSAGMSSLGQSAHPIGANGIDPLAPLPAGGAGTATSAASTAANTAASAGGGMLPAAGTQAASGGAGGFLKSITSNPLMMGQMLQGVGGMLGGGNEYKDRAKAEERLARFAYGGTYSNNSDPFGVGGLAYAAPKPRYYYDPVSKQVVDRQQEGAG